MLTHISVVKKRKHFSLHKMGNWPPTTSETSDCYAYLMPKAHHVLPFPGKCKKWIQRAQNMFVAICVRHAATLVVNSFLQTCVYLKGRATCRQRKIVYLLVHLPNGQNYQCRPAHSHLLGTSPRTLPCLVNFHLLEPSFTASQVH